MTTVLLVGDTTRAEFREAAETLREAAAVTAVPQAEEATAMLRDGAMTPDVIVLAQAYPGEFSAAAVDGLRRLAPLAPIVGLLGSWCEGEMRSGHPWPGAVRVYWHQWSPRCRRELARIARGECSTWTLPPTATEEERLLWSTEEPLPAGEGLVAIDTPHRAMHNWLSEALRGAGYATVWLRGPRPAHVTGARAAISDGDAAELSQLLERLRPTPVIALLDFPRAEDRDRAIAAGAAAVLSKPVNVQDLLASVAET